MTQYEVIYRVDDDTTIRRTYYSFTEAVLDATEHARDAWVIVKGPAPLAEYAPARLEVGA